MNERIGVITGMRREGPYLQEVHNFGLCVCQLCCWNADLYDERRADTVRRESEERRVRITSLWSGWPGPAAWNFIDGPVTLGLVPREYRAARMAALRRAGEFAQRVGIPAVVTHLGFLPEDPRDPVFEEVVGLVKELAEFYGQRGIEFWFETGQETPVTLLRLIQNVGAPNLGVNLDTGNLILYGKGNPIDALDVFGRHVRGVHAKDGLYPTDPMKLGHEVKVGTGKVRFPEFVRALEGMGYRGAYIIEREIRGEQQARDIAETVKYLDALLSAR